MFPLTVRTGARRRRPAKDALRSRRGSRQAWDYSRQLTALFYQQPSNLGKQLRFGERLRKGGDVGE